jgi:hypothetical protein
MELTHEFEYIFVSPVTRAFNMTDKLGCIHTKDSEEEGHWKEYDSDNGKEHDSPTLS